MIIHLFNSSSVSGPEQLVLPALAATPESFIVVNLLETRNNQHPGSSPLEEFCRSLGLRFEPIVVQGRWDRAAVAALRSLLERLSPDLVHAHDVKASFYLLEARRGGRLSGFPILSTHHGIHGRPDWKTRGYEWLYRKLFLKSFDRTLCVSNADYKDMLKSGISRDRVRLHINGVNGRRIDEAQRPAEAAKIRAQWLPQKIGAGRLFLFGVVGRLSAEKDHARLLRILDGLNRLPGCPEWKCLVFGTGPLEKSLREQARRLGLEKRVLWMGFRPNVGNELAGLDLLLSFSKAEGLPINLVEAGWAGTPVLCTRVGGVTDLIPDESYGNSVPSDEPTAVSARRMLALLSEEGRGKLKRQAQRFQERVTSEFTREKWLERLREIYAEFDVRFDRETRRSP
jgi:glycosyltransferase involved in cell wall biosynthesis